MRSENSVSVITRTKDRPLLLSRSIESVLNQTHQNWSHIIINDGGSSGAIHQVISKFSSRYQDRLTLIENTQSLGTTSSLNIGMKAANSDYVITHDDDDSWESTFLEKSIESLTKAKSLVRKTRGIVSHTTAIYERIEESRVVEDFRYSFNGWIKTISLTRLAAGNFIPPISFLFDRSVFSEIGFFNEEFRYAEDWEFYLRFSSHFEIAVLPTHLANYHFRSATSGSYGNTVIAGLEDHVKVAAALRNEMIRRDLASGKFGMGYLIAMSSAKPLPGNLRHKLWGIRKRTLARLKAKLRIPHARSSD